MQIIKRRWQCGREWPGTTRLDDVLNILHLPLLICFLLFFTLLYISGGWPLWSVLLCSHTIILWSCLTMGTIDRISENWGRVRAGYIFPWILPTMSPLTGSECFSQFRAISVTLSIPLYTLSFRNCSFPYSLALRGGNHSFLTPTIPEYYIISVFSWYYDKSWLYYYKNSPFVHYTLWLHHLFPNHWWLMKVVRKGVSDEVTDNMSLEVGSREEKIQERTF